MDKAPVSLSEARALKAGDAALLSPRDTLVMMLREIDDGLIAPDFLIVSYRARTERGVGTFYSAGGSSDYHLALGLLEAVKGIFQQQSE